MKGLNKKIYYQYVDLYRMATFNKDKGKAEHALRIMQLIQHTEKDIISSNYFELLELGFTSEDFAEIEEFQQQKKITAIELYKDNFADWIRYLIIPEFYDLNMLADIFHKKNITTLDSLIQYFQKESAINQFGKEQADLYAHFAAKSSFKEFPTNYRKSYTENDSLLTSVNNTPILGNFHNHTKYSDGKCSLEEIVQLAETNKRDYIGISDHTISARGVSEYELYTQLEHIGKINQTSTCNVLKGIECEILKDGSLDMPPSVLSQMDYVISAIHIDYIMLKSEAEHRLIKALENPFTNILAHPSSRLYHKKIELFIDMYKIIDACAYNNVAIEINGDPDRIDLDPTYINYAIKKGVMFTIDSDTHTRNGFKNINNAIKIAEDYSIPNNQILNLFAWKDVQEYFKSHKHPLHH